VAIPLQIAKLIQIDKPFHDIFNYYLDLSNILDSELLSYPA
jgi:hypothetical protein